MARTTKDALRDQTSGPWPQLLAALAPQVTGFNDDGTAYYMPVEGQPAKLYVEAVTTVAAMSTVNGASRTAGREVRAFSSASGAHTLRIEGSDDGVTWDPYGESISTMKGLVQTAALVIAPCTPFVRAQIQNGNLTALTGVRLRCATLS